MAIITIPGPISGKGYRINIAGDTPTMDEQLRIDSFISQAEQQARAQYEARYGEVDYESGLAPLEGLGEFFKGAARGGVGMVESAALGAAAFLPESFEAPTREAIRSGAYALKPQADIGREGSVTGTFGEAVGSFVPLAATTLLPGGQAIAGSLAAGAGAGEASERARAGGATEDERNLATLGGAAVGLTELIPINFLNALPAGTKATIAQRLQRAAATGGVEAAQEAASSIAQNLIEQGVYNPEQGALEGAGEAAGYGAGVGGLVQGMLDLFVRQRGPEGAVAPAEVSPDEPTAPAAAPASEPAAPAEVEGEFDELFPVAGINTVPPVPMGTPEFEALTSVRQAQESAYAQALKLSPSFPAQVMKLAAEGKSTPEISRALGRVIATVAPKGSTAAEAAKMRNAFIDQVKSRIGIPADPSSVEFDRWMDNYTKFTGPTKKAKATAATPTAPQGQSSAPTAQAAPESAAPSVPTFTPAFATEVLGFGKGSGTAKAAANNAAVAGKPLTDPAVQALLQSRLRNTMVREEQKAAIRAALAEPAPLAEPEVSTLKAEVAEQAELPMGTVAPVDLPVAEVPVTPQKGKISPKLAARKPAAVAAPLPEPVPVTAQVVQEYNPRRDTPGATTGTVGQPVAAPPRIIQSRAARIEAEGETLPKIKIPPRQGAAAAPATEPVRRLAVPTDEANIRAAARLAVSESRARDSVNNRELGDQLAATIRAGMSTADVEFLGLNEIPTTTGDVTVAGDKRALMALLKRGGATTPEAKAAKVFFSKFPNPTEALQEIGAQRVLAPKQMQKAGQTEGALNFYRGMGMNAAQSAQKWVKENLSTEARSTLARAIVQARQESIRIYNRTKQGTDPVEDARRAADAMAKEMDGVFAADPTRTAAQGAETLTPEASAAVKAAAAADRVAAATAIPEALQAAPSRRDITKLRGKTKFDVWMEETYSKSEREALTDAEIMDLYDGWVFSQQQGYALQRDAAYALAQPMLPSTRRLLLAGNIKRALESIAATVETGGAARVARALSRNMGTTKVEIVDGLTTASGDPAAGLFDPTTNTIYLDAGAGMDLHTVMHEATHAATSHTLDNPGHPLTKQLKALLREVTPALGPAYGTTNVQEFAAEIFGNVDFQARLAGLTQRGRKITAFDRAMLAIRNFVRRLAGLDTVQMNTALTRGDQLIMAMLSPAPESRNMGKLYMADARGVNSRIVDNALNNAPTATPARLKELQEFLTDRSSDAADSTRSLVKEAVLRLTPLHYLVKLAEPYFPMAGRLNDLVNAAAGDLARVRDTSQALSAAIGKWATKHPDKVDQLNLLINNSTLHQVDPELDATAAGKKYGADPERMDHWRMVKSEWAAVGPEGQLEYRRLRNTFRTLRDDLLAALDLRLQASIKDEGIRKRVRDDLYSDLAKGGSLEPYFPLGRKGDNWLSYNAIDPRTGKLEFFVEAFESKAERDRYIAELSADPALGAGNFRKMPRRQDIDYAQAPDASFMFKLNNKLRAQNVDDKIIKTISDVYLDTIPETSFLQSFRQRKGTLGANRDALAVGTERASNLARNISQLKYGAQFSALKSEITEQMGTLGDNDAAIQLGDQLIAFADFAASPERPAWSRMATTIAFNMTLGFNISTALLNLMQTPMVVLPMLGGRYGYASSTRAIGEAMRMLSGSGMEREIEAYDPLNKGRLKEKVSAAPSLENYDFSNPELPERVRRLRHLVEVGRDNGQFNRSIAYDILDMDSRLPSESKVQVAMNRAQGAAGWMLHHTERFNREAAMAATYNLELDRIAAKEGRAPTEAEMRDAAKQAIYLTEMTNGGTSTAATPRIAQSGLGQVMFMYKRYGVSMYALLFDTAKRALKDQSPEGRAEAWRQIGGIAGMTGLLSGVAGLPMVGTISMIYNALLGDDEELSFNMQLREMVGDGMYRGAINATLGINVAGRIELSNLLFRESQIEREQPALWTLLEQLGGPVVGTYLNVERGVKLMAEGETYDGIMAASPAAVRYILRAIKFGDEGALTRDGDRIIDDLHPGHLLAQALGFAPAEFAMQQEINAARKKFERAVVERRASLVDKYAAAIREGNNDALVEVAAEMEQYNADHSYWPITRATLKRSLQSRAQTDTRTFNGVSFNPRLLEAARQFASDYGA